MNIIIVLAKYWFLFSIKYFLIFKLFHTWYKPICYWIIVTLRPMRHEKVLLPIRFSRIQFQQLKMCLLSCLLCKSHMSMLSLSECVQHITIQNCLLLNSTNEFFAPCTVITVGLTALVGGSNNFSWHNRSVANSAIQMYIGPMLTRQFLFAPCIRQ